MKTYDYINRVVITLPLSVYKGMTEVEYGGRGHRTRLRNDHENQLVCPRVLPCLRI